MIMEYKQLVTHMKETNIEVKKVFDDLLLRYSGKPEIIDLSFEDENYAHQYAMLLLVKAMEELTNYIIKHENISKSLLNHTYDIYENIYNCFYLNIESSNNYL